jgi:hypothetical protein
MNRTVLKQNLVWGLVGLALLVMPAQGQALSLTVDSATVNVGNTFNITLHVADAVDLTSWQFDLAYNPTILQANLVTEGSFLSSAGTTFFTPGVIDNTTGLISLVSASFVDLFPPSGSGVLATVSFTALTSGLSPLTASNVFLNFLDPTGGDFTVTNGSVCVNGATACDGTPVPEPSSLWLMILGGLLVWLLRWSRLATA